MIIGVPKEIKENEHRVGMTPSGVQTLIQNDHNVYVQKSAGKGSGYSDKDFLNIGELKSKINNCDACFHCMGITSFGQKSDYYYKVTFEMTKLLTDLVYEINPNAVMTYVSGEGTSTKENSNIPWANVKGKTENYILNKGLKDAYVIRLGLLIPENDIKAKTKLYNLFYTLMKPLYPLMKLLPTITTSSKLGLAMINCLYFPLKNKYLDNKKINNLCKIHLKG